MDFEYRSRRTLAGLPLLHVAFGRNAVTGHRRVARGIVAVGQIAVGVIAVGQVAAGVVSVGQVAIGVGFALGQLGAALLACGQVAIAGLASLGQLASGGRANGALAWSGPGAVTLVMVIWVLAATALIASAWPRWRRLARFFDGEHRRVAATAPGAVSLQGRVVALQAMEAPVTRRPCVAYQLRSGPTAGELAQPTRELVAEDFVVEDGSGRARVLAAEASFCLGRGVRLRMTGSALSIATLDGGARPDEQGQQVTPAPSVLVEERLLAAGDQVTVVGWATRRLEGGRGLGRTAGAELLIHGGAAGPVLVTNRWLPELRAEVSAGLWLASGMLIAAVAVGLLG